MTGIIMTIIAYLLVATAMTFCLASGFHFEDMSEHDEDLYLTLLTKRFEGV